jgi:hypothetical protein
VKKTRVVALLAGLGTAFTLALPAFAQSVSASASVTAGASAGGLDGLLSTLTGLLGVLGL